MCYFLITVCHRYGLHLIVNHGCEWHMRCHDLVKSVWAFESGVLVHAFPHMYPLPLSFLCSTYYSANYALGFLKIIRSFQRLAWKWVVCYRGWETLLSVCSSTSAMGTSRDSFLCSSAVPARHSFVVLTPTVWDWETECQCLPSF